MSYQKNIALDKDANLFAPIRDNKLERIVQKNWNHWGSRVDFNRKDCIAVTKIEIN